MKNASLVVLFLFTFLCYSQRNESANTSFENRESKKREVASKSNWLAEENYVSINGIEQWLTIKGNPSKPAILFLHGGPGSPMSPYHDALYKDLEKDFIIVQWDQRGTGRTYGRNSPPVELDPEYLKANPLSLDQMANDGVEISKFVLKFLGKQKLILFGTSWGSALAVKIASRQPELFYAYVGHSQIVQGVISPQLYQTVYKIAASKNDTQALNILQSIGKPPYRIAKNAGLFFRIVKKYEKENSTPAPAAFFSLSPSYDNAIDAKNREDGDDYSFVNFVGDEKLGVQSISNSINMLRDHSDFKIPVYLIQGSEDLLTPKENSKKYFDTLTAPKKEYHLIPNAAHGFNQSVMDMQIRIFKSIQTQ